MNYEKQRRGMVEQQLGKRGITDPLVLQAMASVEREKFVPVDMRWSAYRDGAFPIGFCQTISQPYIVALMTEAAQLNGGERVLEIGTGSGYGAAVLANIVDKVITIERLDELVKRAENLLREIGYSNVKVLCNDGSKGCPGFAPYDAILVTAGGPEVPASLREQLAVGGRLIMPVGSSETFQSLLRITRRAEEEYEEEDLGPVRFVPLIGEEGWPSESVR
jgi:protein-L-isoaspartate(D-aspartate) O-methyltransferase